MRTLGVAAAAALITLSTSCSLLGAGGESDPSVHEKATIDALRAAVPVMSKALEASSGGFNGVQVPCSLGRNNFEYVIRGNFVAAPGTWRTGIPALKQSMQEAGWEPLDTRTQTSMAGSRQGIELFVQRRQRVGDTVGWAVKLTGPCVEYTDDGAESRQRGTIDLSDVF